MQQHHFAGVAAGLVMILLSASPPVTAAPSECPEHFAGGQAPQTLNPKLLLQAHELCFIGFGVEHSGQTRTPLWSAEHLTGAAVDAARTLPREGRFHAEGGLPVNEAANLADYRRSGFDRGHLTPNSDEPTEAAQRETFSLANIVPQAPTLNRGLWEAIESGVRSWAVRSGDLYVVTGPIFQGRDLQALNGRVIVPTLLFKAVYDPGEQRTGVYLVHNTNDSDYEVISVDQLSALTGIDMFPAVGADVKARAARLPAPHLHETRSGSHGHDPLPMRWHRLYHAITGE